MFSRRSSARQRGAVVLAVGALTLGTSTGCTSDPSGVSRGVSIGAVASQGETVGATGASVSSSPSVLPVGVVETVLRSRAAALEDGSQAGWLAPVAGRSLREQQGQVFDQMRSMGVTRLRLVSASEPTAPAPPTSSPVLGSPIPSPMPASTPSSTTLVRARFAYRLAGFDTTDRTFDIDLSLRPASTTNGPPQVVTWAAHDRPQPWDLPHLTVRRSATSLVLASDPEQAADLLARAETAQARVAAVWGRSRPAVWVAPATDSEAARLLGRDPADSRGLRDVAAVTDGPLQAARPAGADRIVIVPGAWSSLTGQGRDVVATHELTHVVVRGSTAGPVPLWLSEGFAEFVAYRTVRLPERDVVRPALEAARHDGVPTGLPTASEFDTGSGDLPAAYGGSLLVVRTLADRDGVPALVRFYREVADPSEGQHPAAMSTRDGGDEQDAVDTALATVLHTSRAALVGAWRARIERLLS